MKNNNRKSAFSLIELSVVILVVGILVLAITQGSRIMKEASLKSALSLTNSSPVISTPGLALWIDATDSSRIATTTNVYGNPTDGWAITNIKGRSSIQGGEDLIFNGGASTAKPTYISNGINGLPVLRFDGVNDYLVSSANINSSRFTDGQQITMFFVFTPRKHTASGYLFRHYLNSSNIYFYIHALTPQHTHSMIGSASYQSANIVDDKPMLYTSYSVPGKGIVGYNNGANLTPSSTTITFNHFSNVLYIGSISTSSSFFNADVAEIIIFNRGLQLKERESIEEYLGQKWGIKIL